MRPKNKNDLVKERALFSFLATDIFRNASEKMDHTPFDENFENFKKAADYINEKDDSVMSDFASINDDVIKFNASLKTLMLYKFAKIEHDSTFADKADSMLKRASENNLESMKNFMLKNHVEPELIEAAENGDHNFIDNLKTDYIKNVLNPKIESLYLGDNVPTGNAKKISALFEKEIKPSFSFDKNRLNDDQMGVLASYFKNPEMKNYDFEVITGTKNVVNLNLKDIYGDDEEKLPPESITRYETRVFKESEKGDYDPEYESRPYMNPDGSRTIKTHKLISDEEFLSRFGKKREGYEVTYGTSQPENPNIENKTTIDEKTSSEFWKQINEEKNAISQLTDNDDIRRAIKKVSRTPYYHRDSANPKVAHYIDKKYSYNISNEKIVNQFGEAEFDKNKDIQTRKLKCYDFVDGQFVLKQPKTAGAKFKFFFTKLFYKNSEDRYIRNNNVIQQLNQEVSEIENREDRETASYREKVEESPAREARKNLSLEDLQKNSNKLLENEITDKKEMDKVLENFNPTID